MNKISVIMSVFNEEEYLIREAVESILNQTYREFEFIIVLDKPDNSKAIKILNEYREKDNRIKLIINDINLGLTASLNKALKVATGQYIARMDADDVSIIERFEKQIAYLNENPDIDFIASNAIIIDDCGNELYRTNNYGKSIEKSRKSLEYRNTFIHPTWIFKTNILDSLIEYNEIPKVEDYDFICRVNLNGYNTIILDDYLLKVRRRSDGISFSNLFLQSSMADIVRRNYTIANKCKDIKVYNPKKGVKEFNNSKINEKRYIKASELYNLGLINFKNKNYIRGLLEVSNSCIKSKLKRKEMVCLFKLKMISGR